MKTILIHTGLFALLMSAQAFAQAQTTNTLPDSGNVGIGTTNPYGLLDIQAAFLSNALDSRQMLVRFGADYIHHNDRLELSTHRFEPQIIDGDWETSEFVLQRVVDLTPMAYIKYSSWNIILGASNFDILRVWNNGCVGIGTNPSTPLDINVTNGRIQFSDTKSSLVPGSNAGGAIYFGVDVAAGHNMPTAAIETSWGGEGLSTPQIAIGVIREQNRRSSLLFDFSGNAVFYAFNEERMRLDGAGNLGIGTATPDAKLTIQGDPSGPVSLNVGGSSNGKIRVRHIDGKSDTSAEAENLFLQFNSPYNTYINCGTSTGNVAIGTWSVDYKLNVNGTIRAKEVIVDNDNWADYVFADDYKLQSLDDVEQHIKTEKHLPGIPSAQEVGTKGVSVGDMQALLLSKIEELTLHQIELNKRINAQDEQLHTQNEKLEQQSRQLTELQQENDILKSKSH